MAASIADRRAAFHQLHDSGCFVIPNPWDAGSAVWLQQAGFKALATTSSGYAWTLALPDNGVGLEGMLAHLKAIVTATEIPVNADFENAYADEPAGVAANVLKTLDHYLVSERVELADRSGDLVQMRLCGPAALQIAISALGESLTSLAELSSTPTEAAVFDLCAG